jgi:hypothetical protein
MTERGTSGIQPNIAVHEQLNRKTGFRELSYIGQGGPQGS